MKKTEMEEFLKESINLDEDGDGLLTNAIEDNEDDDLVKPKEDSIDDEVEDDEEEGEEEADEDGEDEKEDDDEEEEEQTDADGNKKPVDKKEGKDGKENG